MGGLLERIDYVLALGLVLLGLYGMLARTNLVRKLVAMNVLQVGVIVFFLALADVRGGAPPLVDAAGSARPIVNPLPHALMLTAIVVSVSTTGLALALLIHIHRRFGTLDEIELLRRMRR